MASRDVEVALAERQSAGLLRYRKMMLQQAVDSVIDNGPGGPAVAFLPENEGVYMVSRGFCGFLSRGRMSKPKEKSSGTPFESVAKRLKGKQGVEW